MKNLKRLSLLTTLLVGLSTSALAATAPAAPLTKCNLGESCHAPGQAQLVYFYVSQDLGNNFTCRVWADSDDAKLKVTFSAGKDFHFDEMTKQDIGTAGIDVPINGSFSGNEGQIQIRGWNSNDGWVTCKQG